MSFSSNTPNPTLATSQPPSPAPKRGRGCLKGCLGAMVVVLVLGGVATYLLIQNAGPMLRQGSAAFVNKLSSEIVAGAPLPPEQKQQIEAVLNRFSTEISSGKVSMQQAVQIAQRVMSGPLLPQIMSISFKELYLKNSGLSAEEKLAGEAIVKRFVAGVAQDRITQARADEILNSVSQQSNEGGSKKSKIKSQLTDAEIRSVLAQMGEAADAAGIATQQADVDLAKELEQIIAAAPGAQ